MYFFQGCFFDFFFNYFGKFWVIVYYKFSGYNGGVDVFGGVNNFFDFWYILGDVLIILLRIKNKYLYIYIYLCENVLK